MSRSLIFGLLVSLAFTGLALAQEVPGEKMSHSFRNTSLTTSIPCTAEQPWPESGWMRTYVPADFDITSEYQITGVEFGVFAVAGTDETEQTVDVIIWEDEDPDYPIETVDLVELRRETITISDDDSGTVFVYELDEPLVLDPEVALVLEIRAPDFADADLEFDDREFVVVGNELGEHSPSYFNGVQAPCEFTDPLDLTTLDPATFDLYHLIIDAVFEGGCVPPRGFTCEEDDGENVLSWVNSGTYSTIEVIRDGEVIATLEDNEESYTDDEAGPRHTYMLTVSQDVMADECSVDSHACNTGFITECNEADLIISFGSEDVVDAIEVDIADPIDLVEVSMDIDHTWIGDLNITLVSPEGTEITIKEAGDVSDVNPISYEDIHVRWTDDGLSYRQRRLPDGERVQPEGPGSFSDFEEEDGLGEWEITIADTVDFDDGTLENWCVHVRPITTTTFLRGDADGSGSVAAIPDALFLFRFQFAGGAEPPCDDAADADNNNAVSGLPDGLFLLRWMFGGGEDIAAPGVEECGIDPDLDTDIGCDVQSSCPTP